MNLAAKLLCSVVLFICLSKPLIATASNDNGLNLYLAAGPNFVFPTSVRIGWSRWEAGLLTRNFVGVNRTFTSGNPVYAGFGLGVNIDPFQSNLGFQASVGVHWVVFWRIGLRGELVANTNLNGSSSAHALVGGSYGF